MRNKYRVTFSTGEIIECWNARRYHINEIIALHAPEDKVVSIEVSSRPRLRRNHRKIYRAKMRCH